jgi:hypothetical protein
MGFFEKFKYKEVYASCLRYVDEAGKVESVRYYSLHRNALGWRKVKTWGTMSEKDLREHEFYKCRVKPWGKGLACDWWDSIWQKAYDSQMKRERIL